MITYEELMVVIYNIAGYLLPYKLEKMCKHLENEIEKTPKSLIDNRYLEWKNVTMRIKHEECYLRRIKKKDK